MSFARVSAAQPYLTEGRLVTVEVDIFRNSLHNFSIVGLPERAVDEAKYRVSSAIKNSGLPSPKSKNQKTVVSLSPADLKKEGSYFDLAISLAYLLADESLKFDPKDKLFLGELSLNGDLQSIKGILPLVMLAKTRGFTEVFVPASNGQEAALVKDIKIFACQKLSEVIEHFSGEKALLPLPPTEISFEKEKPDFDFSDIRGQETAKRGLALAAAGGHNMLLVGPPGTGKTLLARAFSGILPPLDFESTLEVTGIHSVAGVLKNNLITRPPIRAPHHRASAVSLIGGGVVPKPGEITLAHRGVLFLDEFPEFSRDVLEALREPLEEKKISVSRANGRAVFPANFILIAAMNPCPCGFFGTAKNCVCAPMDLVRYQKKVSGPILDRIDLVINVENIDHEKLAGEKQRDETLPEKIKAAREKQRERFRKLNLDSLKTNSDITAKEIDSVIELSKGVRGLLNESARKFDLSPRSYHRVLKLTRTIADFEGSENISESHLLEALQYRPKYNFL
ncbi:MAG TPA: YifB family Mg chelatase-like AAA ATPase [Candidatus Paceibacterota bacterium]|nr:YifB family Mg chelatase-like AAA ATPase [Candidatus Paceibacterota bacterium]